MHEYANDKARLPQGMEDVEGDRYAFGYDHLGSLRVVADSSGTIVKEIKYDSFGNILRETNPAMHIPFGFAGGIQDRATGLVKYRFRDYMPDVGRFTAKDPIGYQGGDADLYGYCLDDPVNGIDPSGLDAQLLTVRPENWFMAWIPWEAHSALHFCTEETGDCYTYDPSGSFHVDKECGSNALCNGEFGQLDSYLEFQDGYDREVSITPVPTNPGDTQRMLDAARGQPDPGIMGCAEHTANVLRETVLPELGEYSKPGFLERGVREHVGYRKSRQVLGPKGGGSW